jgi:hypothetical protein
MLELLASFTVLRPAYGPMRGFVPAYQKWRENPTAENRERLEQLADEAAILETRDSTRRFLLLSVPTIVLFVVITGMRQPLRQAGERKQRCVQNGT